jgi:diguanylate cyclase (GGDEF)-like protein
MIEQAIWCVKRIRSLAAASSVRRVSIRAKTTCHEALRLVRRHPFGADTCIALLDIDFFKQVNDRYGHATGDEVLRVFSATARASQRANDVLARWGGEEFLLLLPDAAPQDARAVLQRMAERVDAMAVTGLHGRRITFSAGLATRRAGEPFADTISRADRALYQAKEAGRDRIVLAAGDAAPERRYGSH